MRRFWLLIALATVANAQDDIAAAPKSPYTLQRYVDSHQFFDSAKLWSALHIKADPYFFPKCADDGSTMPTCSSELITVLDPDQTIVLLKASVRSAQAYLRFIPLIGGGWRFEGAFSPSVKYFEPKHNLVRFDGKPFLLITGQGNAGSGLSSEVQSWIDLSRPGMDPVFDFTTEGHLLNGPPAVSREVYNVFVGFETQPEQITISRTVEFYASLDADNIELGRLDAKSVYARQSDGTFRFDPSKSNIPEKEVDDVYENFDPDLSNEDFLRYDLENLKQIASGPDSPGKRWLKQFLGQCSPTAEKQSLEAQLQAGQQ